MSRAAVCGECKHMSGGEILSKHIGSDAWRELKGEEPATLECKRCGPTSELHWMRNGQVRCLNCGGFAT